MPRWESYEFAKIHECCGGLVRWVEAWQTPGVHYTGECIECGEENIVMEDIIPVRLSPEQHVTEFMNKHDHEDLRQLEWDEDDRWNLNQRRIAEELGRSGSEVSD